MEEDILNYLPTVMFRGTPCIIRSIFNASSEKVHTVNQMDTLSTFSVQKNKRTSWRNDRTYKRRLLQTGSA